MIHKIGEIIKIREQDGRFTFYGRVLKMGTASNGTPHYTCYVFNDQYDWGIDTIWHKATRKLTKQERVTALKLRVLGKL